MARLVVAWLAVAALISIPVGRFLGLTSLEG